MEIADRFCKYFTNIGPNLAKPIPNVNPSFRSYLGDNYHPSTTTSDLESICGMFASKKALAMTVSQCMSLSIHFTLFLLHWQILSIYLC